MAAEACSFCPQEPKTGLSGRRAARATLGGGFPTRTLSICAAGSQFPIIHVSAQPPSHPGRSDFPSPVGGSSHFPQGTFPCQSKLKHSFAYTPDRHGYNPGSTRENQSTSTRFCVRQRCLRNAHYSPRAALPDLRRYRQSERCRGTVLVGVTRPSSLIPAHASDQNPPADFGCP